MERAPIARDLVYSNVSYATLGVAEARGGGHSLVSSVPMRDQKNDEKGYFFSRRAVRSADII